MPKFAISLSPAKTKFGPLLFSGDLELGLEKASEVGYHSVELSLREAMQIDLPALKSRLAVLNLSVAAIATGQTYYSDGLSLFSNDRDNRDQTVRRLLTFVDLASELGAMVIIGGIRGKTQESVAIRQLLSGKEALGQVALYARRRDVILLLEPINRYETDIINTLSEGIEYIREIGTGNLRLLADTFHMNLEETSYADALSEAKDYLGYIHLADSNRLAPGWGHTDFGSIFGTLREIGYAGPMGIEVLPRPGDLEAARQGVQFLTEMLTKE